ncbi:hypothetical protein GPECTOR_4g937 [Gonium pectorale]|uniref:DUF647 domain-containing protein n=1 Tax=Gonium pectorale TaxID=33097 RepID=A0A150GYI3_GONPE|nr:hypothetical protein GPECTOR_4g937 [Gonium pectorale]|eukprot:KXZ54865.1 hypothetical protein GPECTOR_4g937 [Gonium pectorale]
MTKGFQAWDTVQALSSYVRGMLSSAAILRGVGVGQKVLRAGRAASPLAAVFTFFLRDLAGMLGGILFAYLEGAGFDSCAKQWRLFADITNDVGMTLELASPLLPRAAFLPIACLGSIARSVTGVAGGATRAALTQHFAVRGNAADVAAKEQSQETATTIVGMVLGMALTRLLTPQHADPAAGDGAAARSSPPAGAAATAAAWLVFLALTALHVAANVAALRCLLLHSLNQPRAEMLIRRYLRDSTVLSPLQVAQTEDLTPPPFRRLLDVLTGAARRQPVQLRWGSRLSALLPTIGRGPGLDKLVSRQATDRRYLLVASSATSSAATATTAAAKPAAAATGGGNPNAGGGSGAAAAAATVHVVLAASASPTDFLRAYVHAHVLAAGLAAAATRRGASGGKQAAAVGPLQQSSDASAAAEAEADAWMARRYDAFVLELAAAGWRPERVTLPRPAWTAEWEGGGAAAAAAAVGGRRGDGLHED